MSQYPVPKSGLDALAAEMQGIKRQMAAMRSAAGTSSQVISNPETGARIMLVDGQIRVWDNYDANPDGYGLIYTDSDAAANLVRLFPPHDEGDGLQNSFTMRGTSPSSPGAAWIYTDGVASIDADERVFIGGGTGVDIDTGGRLGLYGLPSVGSPDYQLGFDTADGGLTFSVVIDSSSKRYKDDINDADIPASFLDIRPVTFYDKRAMESDPESASLKFGAIAEEVHDLGLGEFLVTYRDGEPDALKYPMFAVGLIPFVRQHRDEIAELKSTVAELVGTIDSLTDRLKALEAKVA